MNFANSTASALFGAFSGTATPRMPPITTPFLRAGSKLGHGPTTKSPLRTVGPSHFLTFQSPTRNMPARPPSMTWYISGKEWLIVSGATSR